VKSDLSTNQAKQQSTTLHIGTHILSEGLVGYRWHQSHWWIAEFGCHGCCLSGWWGFVATHCCLLGDQGRRVRTVIESDQKTQSQRDYLPSLDLSTNQAKQQSTPLHIGTHILSESSKHNTQTPQSHWWIAEFGCHGCCLSGWWGFVATHCCLLGDIGWLGYCLYRRCIFAAPTSSAKAAKTTPKPRTKPTTNSTATYNPTP
jgi:hypothetical protein